jgi:glycosyltransferase involved in cell wall biosynthesis
MRVLFDEQIFLLQKQGGISRYFVELIRAFVTTPNLGVDPILGFKTTTNELLLKLSKDLNLGITLSKSSKPINLARSGFAAGFDSPRVDLIHHTFYSKLFWRTRFKGPRISTHYDMIPELFGESKFGINPHLSKHWYYKNVDQIISISNSAKDDLKNIWPDIKTPRRVTHLGNPNKVSSVIPRNQGHVIYVGVRGGYKDAQTLLRAFAATPESLRTKLEFLGGGSFTQTELDLIDELGISNHVTQRDVTDDELETAYSSAHVFILSSKYEGFGLPVLEAMQFGCRAILSDVPALVEVAGDCADYFKAGDVPSLTRVMTSALTDQPDLNPYLESGLLRANEFSWAKTAKLTAAVYQALIY